MWNINPSKFILKYTEPTPEQILRKQLHDAERERVHAVAKLEEWSHHLSLQESRIVRIVNELKQLEK